MLRRLILHVGELFCDGTKEFDAHTDGALIRSQIPHVEIVLLTFARPAAKAGHGTGDLLQVPREIFAARGLRGLNYGLRVNGLGSASEEGGRDVVVQHGRYPAVIDQLVLDPQGGEHLLDELGEELLSHLS